MTIPAGARLRGAVAEERPLQVVGAINAYCALLAQRAGFRALYLSGGGVANASFGLPDLGITTLDDVCDDVRRITDACELPLLVDVDTGWGGAFNIARTIASADQGRRRRRCTSRTRSRPSAAAIARARRSSARTRWSTASRPPSTRAPTRSSSSWRAPMRSPCEGLDAAIERAQRLRRSRRRHDLPRGDHRRSTMYRQFTDAVRVPVLANITEFGTTPLFTVDELRARRRATSRCIRCRAFRAMNKAALNVYETLRREGTQKSVVADDADARRTVRRPRLPRLRAEARRAVRARRNTHEDCMSETRPPAPFKPKKSVALSGVAAGNTALCTVGRTGNDLHYRGYDILDIADAAASSRRSPTCWCTASCRTRAELAALQGEARSRCAACPPRCAACSKQLPAATHPMDVMRTGVSVLGCVLPEKDDHNARRRARHRRPADGVARLDAALLVSLSATTARRIDVETDDDSIGGHFLHLLHGEQPPRVVGARDAHVARSCTPSTSSTRRPSPRA